MATKTIRLRINEHLFDDCPSISQQYQFPACLLSYLRNQVGNTSKTNSKYNFIMSLNEFERSLKPMFDEKEKTYYTENCYETKEISIKEGNIWIKVVKRGKEKHVSIKRTKHLDGGVITYQEKIVPLHDAMDNIPGFFDLLREKHDVIEVERTKYEHKSNKDVVLTLDKATFEDDSSFVVFSVTADFEGNDDGKEVEVNTYPCRSTIVELISKTRPKLYRSLINSGDVKDMNYKSMSQAEFEAGQEEAEKRKKQADLEKKRMLKENKELDNDDKYSDDYIKTRYRCVLKYGLFQFDDDDFDQ